MSELPAKYGHKQANPNKQLPPYNCILIRDIIISDFTFYADAEQRPLKTFLRVYDIMNGKPIDFQHTRQACIIVYEKY